MPMRSWPGTRPKPADGLVAALILALALGVGLGLRAARGETRPRAAAISLGGVRADRIALEGLGAEERRTYHSHGYTLTVHLTPEGAEVEESDCPTQDCVHTGRISQTGQSIVCLPARLSVTLEGGGEDLDLIVG